jgi:hypothetical protein
LALQSGDNWSLNPLLTFLRQCLSNTYAVSTEGTLRCGIARYYGICTSILRIEISLCGVDNLLGIRVHVLADVIGTNSLTRTSDIRPSLTGIGSKSSRSSVDVTNTKSLLLIDRRNFLT